MTQEEILTALYEEDGRSEQDKYRDWLKSQPAAEVLNHTYEYTVREDIVMCMEELELTEVQAKALLASPTPLADVLQGTFEKLETSYMDVIRDTIETRANELYQAQEKLKNTPLYPHSAAYAVRAWGDGHSTTPRFRRATPARRPSSRQSAVITAITGWMPKPL